ncbi:MAG: HAD-IIB family hydrolase [Reinekea sp.]
MDELLFFDLDGTLLNGNERLSEKTRFALSELDRLGVNWTIATGRMPHGAREALSDLTFKHPQVYKNGVLLWDLNEDKVINKIEMDRDEVMEVCRRLREHNIFPWLNTLDQENRIGAVIRGISSPREQAWADQMRKVGVVVQERDDYSDVMDHILNIFAITDNSVVINMAEELADIKGVAVYAGPDMYGPNQYWMDVHHASGSKGDAARMVSEQLGAKKLICFGDSDNDLSMFRLADECYAMGQGLDELKAIATETIGANTEDGVAHFLAQRYGFSL